MNKALFEPITYEPGVGPLRAEKLARLSIRTPAEMLFYFPRSYEDFSNLKDVRHLEENVLQTVCGRVTHVSLNRLHRGGCVVTVGFADGSYGLAEMVFFNQAFRREQFSEGQIYLISGKPQRNKKRWQFPHPVIHPLSEEEIEMINATSVPGVAMEVPASSAIFGLQPHYKLTEGLQQWELRRIARLIIDKYAGFLEDVMPNSFREANHLMGLADAVRNIHFPANLDVAAQARRRFVFQELFLLQLALGVRRAQTRTNETAPILEATPEIDRRIRALFPYDPTAGQLRAISDITRDTVSGRPMNRLLQGDVGCGKTTVAMYALLLAVAHGYQAAVMAPTEVLARQHVRTLERLLIHSELKPTLLTGKLLPKEHDEAVRRIASGEARLIVGTHALLQKSVHFAKLGMVVIDEQHKFGVNQRARLRDAGQSPHYLVMTATPIPRTVTMTLFGDLDVTTIRELPPGRQKTHTYLASEDQKAGWWTFFRTKLKEGCQGYVVVPHIGSSAAADAAAVVESDEEKLHVTENTGEVEDGESATTVANLMQTYEQLSKNELKDFRVGFIHGRMKSEEKEAAMFDFRTGETQVLVSTQVIEVGVDVPNATLMTIESADRFGLSQLHQLRGRITRGTKPGYCCVFTSSTNPDTLQRLKFLTESSDGFQLSEIDFSLRGPGDLFSAQQHGLPPFHIADLMKDSDVLQEAREVAQFILDKDPGLSNPDFRRLRQQMLRKYGAALELGDVG